MREILSCAIVAGVAVACPFVVDARAGSPAADRPDSIGDHRAIGAVDAFRGFDSVVIRLREGVRPVLGGIDAETVVGLEGDADMHGSAGLDALLRSPAVARVRPLMPSFGDAALASQLGLDRCLILEPRDPALVGDLAALASACADVVESARASMGGQLFDAEAFAASAGKPRDVRAASKVVTPSPDDPDDPDDQDVNLAFEVNDPLFAEQYSLENTGQVVGGTPGTAGADIAARDAWSLSTLGEGVTVAVLDGGVSPNHPDLVDRLVPGFNTIVSPNQPADDTDDRTSSHGTHVAGIIAATINNDEGIAGVAGMASIMPVRVLNQFGFGNDVQFSQGLIWAADNGADIASVSIGYPFETQIMRDAVVYAHAQGVLIVSSTGNTPGQPVQFPASYPLTVAVGATTNSDAIWPNSTTGPEITLVAPGDEILSTWDTPSESNTYRTQTGTSMAVPHVSGVAALMRGVNPDMTPDQLGWGLLTSSLGLGAPGFDEASGYGRLDASLAVAIALSLDESPVFVDIDGDGAAGPSDIILFVEYYLNDDLRADVALPFGKLDINDINIFVSGFVE